VTAVSGVLLNHARSLGLHEVKVDRRLFFRRDDAGKSDAPIRAFRAGDRWVVWLSRHLIVGGRSVASDVDAVVGARVTQSLLAVAARRELVLIGNDGRIIERISSAALPGAVERLGTDKEGRIVIDTGNGLFRADAAFLTWEPASSTADWSRQSAAPPEIVRGAREAAYGQGGSLERLLVELHTGRIVGPWGIYLFDAAALCLLFLAGSGAMNSFGWGAVRRRGRNSR
jgi:hypothetical protein